MLSLKAIFFSILKAICFFIRVFVMDFEFFYERLKELELFAPTYKVRNDKNFTEIMKQSKNTTKLQ